VIPGRWDGCLAPISLRTVARTVIKLRSLRLLRFCLSPKKPAIFSDGSRVWTSRASEWQVWSQQAAILAASKSQSPVQLLLAFISWLPCHLSGQHLGYDGSHDVQPTGTLEK
jgi:hypothetical protein